jgi:hypothetical protein
VYVTVGSGAPHRLIVTPLDEPGYIVSEITAEGYLRVQRLPQGAPNPVFDTLQFAQPVWIVTRSGKKLNGVFAGLSVHLQPGRLNAPKMNHPDELYVDIGAKSAEEVRAAGLDLLDPIVLQRGWAPIRGNGEAGPAHSRSFGHQDAWPIGCGNERFESKGRNHDCICRTAMDGRPGLKSDSDRVQRRDREIGDRGEGFCNHSEGVSAAAGNARECAEF